MNAQVWPTRGFLLLGLGALLVLVAGFGLWATNVRIAGAVIAPGRIELAESRQVVQHLDGGLVTEVFVRDGQTVAANDLLLRLDGTDLISQANIVRSQIHELLARRARLEAERDGLPVLSFDPALLAAPPSETTALIEGQQRLFEARSARLAQQVDQLARRQGQVQTQLDGLNAQSQALEAQLTYLTQDLSAREDLLERGLAQAGLVLTLKRERAALMGRMGELSAARAGAMEHLTDIQIDMLRLSNTRSESAITELRDLAHQLRELNERQRALSLRITRLELRAPVGGVVLGSQVHGAGAVVQAAAPIMTIIPQNRQRIIAVHVLPTDVDRAHAGQTVLLRLPAFDQRITPEIYGTLRQISADALVDPASGQTYFRAEVVPDPGQLELLPEGVALLPGMPVEAFLRTQARTPLAYLLKPLSDYFTKAFRES